MKKTLLTLLMLLSSMAIWANDYGIQPLWTIPADATTGYCSVRTVNGYGDVLYGVNNNAGTIEEWEDGILVASYDVNKFCTDNNLGETISGEFVNYVLWTALMMDDAGNLLVNVGINSSGGNGASPNNCQNWVLLPASDRNAMKYLHIDEFQSADVTLGRVDVPSRIVGNITDGGAYLYIPASGSTLMPVMYIALDDEGKIYYDSELSWTLESSAAFNNSTNVATFQTVDEILDATDEAAVAAKTYVRWRSGQTNPFTWNAEISKFETNTAVPQGGNFSGMDVFKIGDVEYMVLPINSATTGNRCSSIAVYNLADGSEVASWDSQCAVDYYVGSVQARVNADGVSANIYVGGHKDCFGILKFTTKQTDEVTLVVDHISYALKGSDAVVIGCEESCSSIVIPNALVYDGVTYNVTKIANDAFKDQINITSVTLPSSIRLIGGNAFSGCTALTRIECQGATPAVLSASAFDAYNAIVYVPKGSKEAYKSASGWSNFAYIYEPGEGVVATTEDGLAFITLSDSEVAIIANEDTPYSGDVEIPNVITYNDTEYSVAKILGSAFSGNANVTSVKLPEGITELADSQFSGCTGLKQIVLPDALKAIGADAFAGTALTSIEIPGGVERIADGFLKDCTTLKTVVLKTGVKVIGHNAFSGCSSLENITIPESVTAIGAGVLNNCTALTSLIIPGSVNYIDPQFCQNCENLKEIILSDSNKELGIGLFMSGNRIGEQGNDFGGDLVYIPELDITVGFGPWGTTATLFVGCPIEIIYIGRDIKRDYYVNSCAFDKTDAVKNVTIAGNATQVSDYMFSGCANLTDLTFGDKIKAIGSSAFSSCNGLTSLSLPNGLETIGGYAFFECASLKTISLSNGIKNIGEQAFNSCKELTGKLVIPSSVEKIGTQAFLGGNFTELIIEDSDKTLSCGHEVTTYTKNIYIGRNVEYEPGNTPFKDWYGVIESVVFGDKVTKIGDGLLGEFGNLRGVLELSENIGSIGENAFSGTNYSLCRINAVTPPAAVSGMFNADELVAIIVPAESQAAYKAAEGWKDYNILVEKEVEVTVSTPGELSKDVIKLKVTPKNVTKLIVHGEIDSNDFSQMKTNFTACHSIDLSDADCAIIPESALQDKKVLTSIVLPDNCIEIKDWAFAGCNSLKCELSLPGGLKTIGYSVFNGANLYGELVLPAKLETIKSGAFHGNRNLEKIVAETGSKLSALDYGTFSSCTGLKEVVLSAAPMTTLHQETFKDCYSLTKAVLPSSLENLGMTGEAAYGVFQNCTSLETIEFPESLKRIYEYAFYGCTKLDGLKFPDGLREVYYDAFNGCSSLSSLDMNNCTMISNIGSNAFANCSDLKKVDLTGCIALEKIDSYAFNCCSSLITLNLPAGLSTIGAQTFGECKALANMTVPALVPPTAADDAFYHVNNYTCIIATPTNEDSWYDYLLATPWGSFMDLENRVGIDVTVDNDIIEDEEGNKHQCGHIWFDRDWHKHHGKHDGARSLSKALVPRTLAEEVTTTTDVSGINGHMSDGLSLYVQNGGMVSFLIVPEDGYVVNSVVYGDEDVTDQLVDGVFTTPAVSDYTSLKVTFDEDNPTAIEQVKAASSNDVCVKGGRIVINDSLEKADVRVYTLGGSLVYKGNERVISLEGHGMYIVTVNGNAHKVVL